ncbi:hypothetical protein Bbelb_200850, partial [Branchiostoma belcheri]
YEAVSGVHKVTCKVTSSGGQTESEESTVTVLPKGTMAFHSSIRMNSRNFTPEMRDSNSEAFQSISTEVKEWYRQHVSPSVPGIVSVRVKDVRPGSVITDQNVIVQGYSLQEQNLYNNISMALRTAVQSSNSLGVDEDDWTLLSTSICYSETVTVPDRFLNNVTLTFPTTERDKHAYSTQLCGNNTSSAGIALAVRRCTGDVQTGVRWASPGLLNCGLDLSNLAQMTVTTDNVAEVAAYTQILTSIGSSLMVENITDASTVLENIADIPGDENVGYSVVVSIDQIMNADDGVLYQSQVKDQAPTSVGFASLANSEGLQDESVRHYPNSASTPIEVDASIALPEDLGLLLKKNISDDPTNDDVRLNFVIYQSSRLFQSNQTASFLAGSKTRVNSRIIASRITHFELKNLSTPVVLRYLPIVQNSTNNTVNNIRCVFWDFTAAEGRGDWSTEGCDFVKMDNKRIVCNCSHLTNFAVLMDIYGPWHSFTLDIISKIGIALSTTGLAFTLISYLVFKQLRQTRPQHILMNLCIALLATLIIFLAGIDATNSPVGCTTVAFLLHYFLLAVFMWMAVEAFNMYLAFVKVLGAHVSRFLLKAAIFAWGLPFIVAIITLAVDVPSTYPDGKETYRSTTLPGEIANSAPTSVAWRREPRGPGLAGSPLTFIHLGAFCWLKGNQLYYGFLLPVGLVLLFNTVVYIMVITKLTCGGKTKGKVDDNNSGGKKQQLRIAIAVMVLVGLTWIFGFFMISDGRVFFSYLFCIFNSLQGFFIFIFHCLRQKEVQNLWFKYCGCLLGDFRTTKSTTGKSSSNQNGSSAESNLRGERRDNTPESVPMETVHLTAGMHIATA